MVASADIVVAAQRTPVERIDSLPVEIVSVLISSELLVVEVLVFAGALGREAAAELAKVEHVAVC